MLSFTHNLGTVKLFNLVATFSSGTVGSISFLVANGLIDSVYRVKTGAEGNKVDPETAIGKRHIKKVRQNNEFSFVLLERAHEIKNNATAKT